MSSDSVVYHKLSKIHTHKKGAKKEPPDARLFAYVSGLDFYTRGRSEYIPLLIRSANQ